VIGNAIFIATAICMALGLWLLQECQFLVPYRHALFTRCATAIGLYAAAVFINIFAAAYWLCRLLFLKDTGRKLAHLEKQLRAGDGLAGELSRRLNE
jgi:hypothetical protein